jgi:hypothetical protein
MHGNENNAASWYNDPIQRQAMGIQAGDFLPGGVSARGIWNPGETPEVGGFDGGGGGGFSLGGGAQKPLDTTRGDYGLQTIWSPKATIAESNAWADSIARSQPGNGLTQFDINTFSDPMAKRQGRGRYFMNPGETFASSPGHWSPPFGR